MDLEPELNSVSLAVLRHVRSFGKRGLVAAVVVASMSIVVSGSVWGLWLAGTPEEQWLAAIVTAMVITLVVSLMVATPIVDISSALATALEEVARRAATDALTGAMTRQAFFDAADRLERTGTLVVAMIDVDRFKLVNDRHGHAAGDTALVNIVARLRETLPSASVGRLGGDEFAVAVRAPHDNVERSLRLGLTSVPISDEVNVSCSFGMSLWGKTETLGDALYRADVELLERKRSLSSA